MNQINLMGFKLVYENPREKTYQIFGKNNITLTIKENVGFEIEHNRHWPDQQLIETRKQEFSRDCIPEIEQIKNLVDWINECTEEEKYEFKDNDDKTYSSAKDIILPTIDHDKTRKLFIVVWGRQIRKAVPETYKIEKNFNAAVLYGKKKGINWRDDARTEEVRLAVMKGKLFPDFMCEMIKCIETNNFHRISINCAKGRHRSVTCAIVLKQYYYPTSEIEYLEI